VIVLRRFLVVLPLLLGILPVSLTAAERQVLGGHVPKGLARLQALEALPADTQLDLAIALPLRNRDALTNLLRDLYDPASPQYHHYLTAAEFAARFGPREMDYQALKEFAQSKHLGVIGTHPNRTLLDVSGSAANIEKAFAIHLRRFKHPTEQRNFYAPDSEPSIELATAVLSISGLDDYFLPRPVNLNLDRFASSTFAARSYDSTSGTPFASGTGPRGSFIARDFRAAYAPGVSLDGSGQAVGLFEMDGYFPGDITAYERLTGLPNVPLTNSLLNPTLGGAGPKNIEVALDIDMTISMAPGLSQVIVYEGRMGNSILNRMATDNQARQLSCSWSFGSQIDPAREQIFLQFAAQGQSYFQAAGDSGAYPGAISPPIDDAFATVVGGTVLTTDANGAWASESTWAPGSGGISTSYPIPIWQKGVSMALNHGSATMRNIPDVACMADASIWLVANNGQQGVVGGTSAATPLWAGFTALVNQQAAANGRSSVGFLNPVLYAIGQGGSYSASFHDITTGNNTNGSSPTKFFAVPGYDLCTGWGTPTGSNLIAALLAPPDALRITPGAGAVASGPVGGPFVSTGFSYVLTNSGAGAISWTLANTSTWLSASSSGGVLIAGGPSTNETISINSAAGSFLPGSYTATLWFTNLNDGFAQQRQLTLDVITPPTIASQPTNLAVFAGANALFTVGTASNALVLYQWQLNGTNLADGGNRFGSSTATLTISNAMPADAGTYSVIVSNALGIAASTGAVLTVASSAPGIAQQPASQSVLAAASATLTATAFGSQPLYYFWQKDGTNLSDGVNLEGSSASVLTINNAGAANAGNYTFVVSNALGSSTSTVATLIVIAISAPEITLSPVYSFTGRYDGANPNALALGSDGNFYGTTQRGGSNSAGTIFQLSPIGSPVTIYSFSGTNDGATPFGTLAQTADGNWYGTTLSGGAFENGTVFKFGPAGLTTLVTFNMTNGDLPYAGVTAGADGYLYGTTYQGGSGGFGTAFQLGTNGVLTTLASFNGNGGLPYAGLAPGLDGSFYGTTFQSASGGGTVFKVTTNGVLNTLFSFGGTNGINPQSALAQGDDGNFYGTTSSGGLFTNGALFRITAAGVITNLHTFTGGGDGGRAMSGLLLASDGNFYGTTAFGGSYGKGTVFKLTPGGVFTTLACFDGFNGANPETTLAQDADGSFFGTTQNGGAFGHGTIFRFDIGAPLQITGQPLSENVYLGGNVALHVATYGSLPAFYQWSVNGVTLADGAGVSGSSTRSLVISNAAPANAGVYSVIVSNVFGSVTSADAFLSVLVSPPIITTQPTNLTLAPGAVAVFRATVAGDEPLFYQWQRNGVNLTNGGITSGATTSSLTLSNVVETNSATYSLLVSNALGVESSTGAVLLVIPPSAPGTRLATLYTFTGGNDGRTPNGLIQGADGRLYGTTQFGGAGHAGTAFSLATNVSPPTILAAFSNSAGMNPLAPLVQGVDGNFYGTTEYGGAYVAGNVFRLTTSGALATIYSFTGGADGNGPSTALTQGADGNFYGTTWDGGAFGAGNVFRLGTNGALTNLYSFTGGNDGSAPDAIIQGTDGNFYGVTGGGGTHGFGSVYKLTPNGAITTLYSFNGGADGYVPVGALVQGSDVNFYGVTKYNTISGFMFYGTVFRITPAGGLTTLYPFNYGDGTYPAAGLIQGSDGNFYGTTYSGGANGFGTVFAIAAGGAFTTLASFDAFDDGAHPESAVVQGVDGNLYGTTTSGGPGNGGTIFKLSITSAPVITSQPASQTAFVGANVMLSVAVFGSAPMTYRWMKGGTNLVDLGNVSGSGNRILSVSNVSSIDAAAYSVLVSNALGSVASAAATLAVTSSPPKLVTQPASQLALPTATVTFNASAIGNQPLFYQWQKNSNNLSDGGNVLGSTTSALMLSDVSAGDGGIYSVVVSNILGSIASTGAVLTVPFTASGVSLASLYSFSGGSDGGNPNGLSLGNDGQLYGTAQIGGTNGLGTIFRLSGTNAPVTIYSFTGGNDGATPYAKLTLCADGNFYGSTFAGGASGAGTIFQATSNGVVNPLYSFTGGNDGGLPFSELVQGTNNILYGAASGDGRFGYGGLFEITTNGAYTTLYSFTGGNDGAKPKGGLARDFDGTFFGVSSAGGAGGAGTVFKLTEAGAFTNLHSLGGGTEGNSPSAALVRGADGNFYGTAQNGGTSGNGAVFRVTKTGIVTDLYSFSGPADGSHPVAGLFLGGDGNFCGATSVGGPYGDGTLFKITPAGTYTALAWFGGTNGANPEAALVQGVDGALYGTTQNGGASGVGTIFRVSIPLPPVFVSATQTSGTVRLSWSAVAGRTYQLQYTSSLGRPAWQNSGSAIIASAGTVTAVDSVPPGAQRFYRVVLTQ
jgi:uncharacterized repeat protein (TIGR03803 family)